MLYIPVYPGKHFSMSAKLCLAAWAVQLARLVTGAHWPAGWLAHQVRLYLTLLDRCDQFSSLS